MAEPVSAYARLALCDALLNVVRDQLAAASLDVRREGRQAESIDLAATFLGSASTALIGPRRDAARSEEPPAVSDVLGRLVGDDENPEG